MATGIPPHNLREVVAACTRLLECRTTSLEELCTLIPGPDLPTGATIITPPEELLELYRTGTGTIRQRACWQAEGRQIVITALPHQTPAGRIVEQIDSLIRDKKVPGLVAVRDESDHLNPVRIVLSVQGRDQPGPLLLHLYACTELQRSYRVNINVIGMHGRPHVYGLRELLLEWLDFRMQTVRLRLQHQHTELTLRLEICEGLCVVYQQLDEVIQLLREQEDAGAELQRRFGLGTRQIEAVLQLPLRRLARPEERRILAEVQTLQQQLAGLEKLLDSRAGLATLVKKELQEDAERYGDARRSTLSEAAEATLLPAIARPPEPVVVVLSRQGWVRAVRGGEPEPVELHFRGGDALLQAMPGDTGMQVAFLDSRGRCYTLPIDSLPGSRGHGEPLSARLHTPDGILFAGLALGSATREFLLSCSDGYGYRVVLNALCSRTRSGKAVLSPGPGAQPLPPARLPADADRVALASTGGYLLVCPLEDLPQRQRGRGVRLLSLPGTEQLAASAVLAPNAGLRIQAGARHMTLRAAELQHYQGARARRGRILPRGFRRIEAGALLPESK